MDGYLYTKAVELKGGWSLRCVNHRMDPKCSGTATLDLVNDIVVPKVAHNHNEMEAEEEVVRFAQKLKATVEESNIVDHYDEVSKDFSEDTVSALPLSKARHSIYKHRQAIADVNNRCPMCLSSKRKATTFKPCGHRACGSKVDCPIVDCLFSFKVISTKLLQLRAIYRNMTTYAPRLAQFYLNANMRRKDNLHEFSSFSKQDPESFVFVVAIGCDGAPICVLPQR